MYSKNNHIQIAVQHDRWRFTRAGGVEVSSGISKDSLHKISTFPFFDFSVYFAVIMGTSVNISLDLLILLTIAGVPSQLIPKRNMTLQLKAFLGAYI